MIEEFKPTRTFDQRTHKHREFQSVICGTCGFIDNIPCSKWKPLAPEVIIRQMKARGWLMGNKRRDDCCPKCVKNRCRIAFG